MRKCYGEISGDGCYIFLTAYLCVWVMAPPPPWDPVGTGNFWPMLAACPLPQARLRQQLFRECLSTGGESEKETNSRGPRKLRQTWESFEIKGGWGSHELRLMYKCFCTHNSMQHLNVKLRGEGPVFSHHLGAIAFFFNSGRTRSQCIICSFFPEWKSVYTIFNLKCGDKLCIVLKRQCLTLVIFQFPSV